MTDAPEKVEIRRDRALEARLLQAVIDDQNSRPRNQQVQVGPSSIGYCRELARAEIFEGANTEVLVAPLTHWPTAAHVGSAMGDELERIFGQRLASVITQERVTTYFDQLGVSISGAIDLAFIDDDHVSDLKSVDDMGSILYDLDKNAGLIETLLMIWRQDKLFDFSVETPDGGYELTQVTVNKFSKLKYWIQVSVYVVGAIQAGLLTPEAEARLIFYDRSGAFQEFVAVEISNEEVEMFYDLGQARVAQIAQAQELFERTGNLHLIHQLRDQTPSFCFSPKVMCPLRERCWGGSEWEPEQVLDSPEVSTAIDRYIEGRRLSNIGDGMKKSAREELKGIEGTTPDGRKVSWPGNRINVVETAAKVAQGEHRPARSAVDMAIEAMARVAPKPEDAAAAEQAVTPVTHVHTTSRGTKACSEGRCNPKTIVEEQPANLADNPGVIVTKPVLVTSEDAPPPYFDGSNAEISHDWKGEAPEPDPGAYLRPDEYEAQAVLDGQTLEEREQTEWPDHEGRDGERPQPWPTPAEEVLATAEGLTDAQREYLERVAARRERLDDLQQSVADERKQRGGR